MKYRDKMIGAVMLASVLMTGAYAQDQSYTLKHNSKEGDVMKYKLIIELDLGGQAILATGSSTSKVTKVETDGARSIDMTAGEMLVKFGEQEMTRPGLPPLTTVYKANGEIAEIKGEGADTDAYRRARAQALVFSDKAVKVGDKWSYEMKPAKENGAGVGKTDVEVLAVEKMGDQETLKLKFSFKETSGDTPLEVTGTLWIGTKDSEMVKAVMNVKNYPIPGVPMPIEGKITLERS
jgi:hypothetical protein